MTFQRMPLYHLASCNDDLLSEATDPNLVFEYVDISNVTQGAIGDALESMTFARAPSRARRIAQAGDVILATVRTYLRAIAPVDEGTERRVYSTGFAVFRPKPLRTSSRYLAYRMQADDFLDEVVGRSVGVSYPAITAHDLMHIRLTAPPSGEQHAIADFLDRETAKIDLLIEKQSALIDRLRERRTAQIVRTTSVGLEHSGVCESGIYWAPRIPLSWSAMPLKRILLSVQTGVWGKDEDGGDGDVPCVRVADFDRPRLRVGPAPTIRSVTPTERAKCSLRRGDLLIEKSGGTAVNPVGFVVAYDSDEQSVYANFIARLRVRAEQVPRYWLYVLYGSYASGLTWRSVKQTTGIQNLDMGALRAEKFPVPNQESQLAIVEHLDRETARINALIGKVERFVELARERRSALITAAVTGETDVIREAGS